MTIFGGVKYSLVRTQRGANCRFRIQKKRHCEHAFRTEKKTSRETMSQRYYTVPVCRRKNLSDLIR